MPSFKPFVITMGDINYLLDQMRDAIKILRYDANGQPVYGYVDTAGASHELGLFGAFNPLAVTDAVTGLSIYDGAREASGFRLPIGFFNNLVSSTSWTWGATNDPFPRLTAADYNHYVQQSLTNPALIAYEGAHLSFVPAADNSANYADLNKTVVDYTPRMITQTISSSYGGHAGNVADSALTRMDVATDTITESVTARDGTVATQTETIVRNLNTLPGDPSTSGIFTLFGQFFDHGLDFIDKGGQGSKIVIPLDPNDPLYRAPTAQDPGNTTITISRATPDGYTVTDQHGRPVSIAGADGVWGTSDDVSAPGTDGVYGTADDVHAPMVKPATTTYTNHTSPYIDQSQSYGSNTQTTNLLREWVKDPNTGLYRPGAELLDGHRTQAYNSQVFNDASPNGLGVGTTTRTVPTLNEMREHIRDTQRADLTWDDINNLRARDDHGQVIDTNGPAAGGYVYTGEALLLDMNPRFDAARLQPNDGDASTDWDLHEASNVTNAIAYMNANMNAVGRAGDVLNFGLNPQTSLNELQLTLATQLDTGPGGILPAGTVLHGAYALAPWVNFANFSIIVTDPGFYSAVGEIMMASVGDHYIAGDGRANENFGLTALHHVFHENHNVQLVNLENMILTSPEVTARNGYQLAVNDGHGGFYHDQAGNYTLTDQSAVAVASIDQVSWDPDKMFETVKLINEMEYQHTAIDQYARLVTPDLPEFVTYDSDINADISLEYSQAAFRFGHSQLRETIDAIDPSGMVTKFALEGAFLNPEQFAAVGASNILRGMSQQVSNEVDEFVTPAMQQTLLGQALDLGAINIARGRDVGMPTLNEVRKQLHDALVAERAADPNTPHHSNLIVDALNPYTSWAEFGSQMQHPESLVNFIAAYAFDGDLTKAQELIDLETGVIVSGAGANHYTIDDAIGFLNNSYSGTNSELVAGEGAFNNIDFWIGGLAELHVFTGQLGTTFNAIFEDQMERLMDGDRFYYIYRLQDSLNIDTDLGHAIVTEQFKDIIERTTGVMHLNGDVMGYSDSTLELARKVMPGTALTAVRGQDILDILGNHVVANQGDLQYDASHNLITQDYKTAHAYGDILAANDANGIHMGIYSGVGGGTAGNGTILHKSNADLGFTNQAYIADFRPDMGENPDGTPASGYNSHETLAGTDYNDWIDAGNGDDTVYGDKGDDVLDGKAGADHLYGGDGQDVLYGGDIEDFLDGGEGDDIVYAGTSAGALDVVIGGGGNDKLYGEAGIDEIYGGSGDDYIDAGGDTDLAFGDSGNDIMFGGDGPDELRGGLGDDMLSGGSGADVLKGEGGDDLLFGGIGQNALNGDSDELLGDVGFDMSVFSDTNIVLDTAADLRNQNLVAAGGATPYNPFSQLWADLEGVVGSKFADKIIGEDGDNWLIGGGGNDTFGTTIANTDGIVGSGGNDVIIGGHIRLDTLIGTYGGYTSGFDANGNATHGVTGTLTGGLLANNSAGIHTELFAKHYTDLLMTERNKDLVLGNDAGTDGTSDTVVLSGNKADYTITAISYNSAHEGTIVAYKVTDNGGLNPDGTARAPSDGTDLIVGIDFLQFRDQTVSLNNVAPALDLHAYNTATGSYADNFNTAAFNNSNGTTAWTTPWTETGDSGGVTSGQIQIDAGGGGGTNELRFLGGAASDGASIQRTVNLAGASSATVSYTFDQNNIDPGETVTVQFSADGSFNPATLQTIQTITNTSGNFSGSGTTTVALTGPFSANSAIRFVASGINSTNEDVRIDNLSIAFTTKTSVNDASNDYQATYIEGGSSVRIAAGPSITDDGPQMVSAKIVLTNAVTGDTLNRNDIAADGITGTTDTSVPGQVTVNLTGAASLAAYQNAIEAITFSSNSNNPTGADRIIHVSVNDGLVDSNVATTTIHVTPVNDPPNAGNDSIITNYANGTNNVSFDVPDWALLANDTDPDSATLSIAGVTESQTNFSVSHTASAPAHVTITKSNASSHQFSYTVSDGSASDTANATVATDTSGNLDGTTGNNIIVGDGNNSMIDGGTGDDIIFAGAGNDTVVWNTNSNGATDGHDFVDGGTTSLVSGHDTGSDSFVVTGRSNSTETFSIYSNTDDWDNNAGNGIVSSAAHAGFTGLNANTEIVVARNGTMIAELDNIEEITINALNTTANNGNGGPDAGTSNGDTIQVIGNFTGTSLNYSTIHINGGDGNDTVDISGLTSDHRIVFHGGGGDDHVIGTLRPQDVVDSQTAPSGGDQGGSSGSGGGQDGGHHDSSGDDNYHCSSGEDHGQNGGDGTPIQPADIPGMPAPHIGTAGDDVMIGASGDNVLSGLDGDDLILGNDGADTLKAGDGDDLVKAGAGDDVVFGNEGNDDLFGGEGRDLITGDGGDDRLFGDAADDALEGGTGNDIVYGGAGNDRIIATVGDGDDTYFGDTEEDTLDYAAISANITADLGNGISHHGSVMSAQSGTDTVFGFEDFIGGSGNDTIIASAVANVMDGGGGNNTFVFGSAADADGDTIKGFQPGDKIDLSAIDANTGASGTQSFVLFAGNIFTSAGQVIVTQEVRDGVDHTFVSGNTNNDTVADFKIDLGAGNHAVTSSDFNGVH
jgi:Ca2+-binding RTX toxin-like protein